MKKKKNLFYILLRYLILLGLMFTLPLFYKILTPITINTTTNLLKLFYQVSLENNIILLNNLITIEIIPACIAGSAYLLFLILNLTISMKLNKRIKIILLAFISLFIINILRIVILATLTINNFQLFDLTHKLFWYGLSTIIVIIIWFILIKIFSIKKIPVYSDIKYIFNSIKKR